MEEIDWNDMYPERPIDYDGMYEVMRHYDYLEFYESIENIDYEEPPPFEYEEPSTPPPTLAPVTPPPAPRKRARPADFDMELLPPAKRLCF